MMPDYEIIADAFYQLFGEAKGKGSPEENAARARIETLEAEVIQPPVFWTVEGVGNRWLVLYVDKQGWEVGCFPRAYPELARKPTELESLYVAVLLNLHPASRKEGRPMMSIGDIHRQLAMMFPDGPYGK